MFPDGVYLNVPHANYLADPALGSSDLKAILVNAVQWHGRQRNPVWRALLTRADPKSLANAATGKAFGTALHVVGLEPEAFEERYYVKPPRPDLPRTKEALAAALLQKGIHAPPSSAKLAEFEARARMFGVQMADDWEAEVATLADGREPISDEWFSMLTMLRKMIDGHPKARQFIGGGRSEVSVFWTDEHGDRYKVRFDHLRARTVADLKTYAMREGMEAIECFCSARDRFGYEFSAAMYLDARLSVLPGLVDAGKVYDFARSEEGAYAPADGPDGAFFAKVAAEDPANVSWWWVACATAGVPEVDTIEFPRDILAFSSASVQVDQARANYREFRARHGADDNTLWTSGRGLVRLTDHNFGRRSIDRGAILWESVDG